VTAAGQIGRHDEERARLDSAVKASDGFFTTFFVSPYSKYIARWAARRGWSPNAVTVLSAGVGLFAAAGFATGERWGMVAGALLLQAAFTLDCVDGQLARYTGRFSALGGWLDGILDRAKEYAVYAGLAIGGADVWLLAGAAMTLQTARHAIDFSFPGSPSPPGATVAGPGVWLRKIAAFPIGERLATISLTAALFDARVTFVVLLVCGGAAAVYALGGRILRRRGAPADAATLTAYRDDGPLALAIGRLVSRGTAEAARGEASAVVLAVTGVVPLLAAAALAGDEASWWLAGAAAAWLVLGGGLSAGSPPGWAVPALLRVGEYAGILWIGAIAGAVPAAFALLAAIGFRHYDAIYRPQTPRAVAGEQDGQPQPPRGLAGRPRPPRAFDGGWDGRLLAALALCAAGAAPAGLYALAGVLASVLVAEAALAWAGAAA
jgi:phosphatidylglycerophosphate synthase